MMKNLFISLIFAMLVTGCVRRINIEQGNIMTPAMVKKIHVGMTPLEVENIMGSPVLLNTFNDNRLDYVYTFKPGGGKMTEQYLTLIFQNNHLQKIQGNMYSIYMQ